MQKSKKILPLELPEAEIKKLIVETLLKAREVFPKMEVGNIEIGARQPVRPAGILSAWRIATSHGQFDISNHHRLVGITPDPEAKLKKKGKLDQVVKTLFEAWCTDWLSLSIEFAKAKDPGGWIHVRQQQLSSEVCIFSNTCKFRFYDDGGLETFSRTDAYFSRTEPVRLLIEDAREIINKIAKVNKLDFLDIPALEARLEGELFKTCYVARGTNRHGYTANIILDADTGEVLRADN